MLDPTPDEAAALADAETYTRAMAERRKHHGALAAFVAEYDRRAAEIAALRAEVERSTELGQQAIAAEARAVRELEAENAGLRTELLTTQQILAHAERQRDEAEAQLAAQQPVIDAAAELRTYWRDWPEERRQGVKALSQYVHAAAERVAAEYDAYRAASGSVEADTPAEPGEAPGRALLREVLDTLGMAGTRDWDDVLNVLRCWRKQREVADTPAAEPAPDRTSELERLYAKHREFVDAQLAQYAGEPDDLDDLFPPVEPTPDDVRAGRYSVRFDDLFHVPPSWLSWRCDLGGCRVDPGYVDGACRYDHNVKSWSQLAAEADEHLARWHPHIRALAGVDAPTEPADDGFVIHVESATPPMHTRLIGPFVSRAVAELWWDAWSIEHLTSSEMVIGPLVSPRHAALAEPADDTAQET